MAGEAKAVAMPFNEAVEYFRQKIDLPTKHWTEVMDEAHARSFAIAGATDKAMLADFGKALDGALVEGTGFQKFRGQFDEIVKKYGWQHTGKAGWRAKIIYETNMRTAYAAGRYAQQTRPAVLAAFPYWQYLHVNCPNPRLQHLAWSGMVLRADDPFWATNYPPNGWGCHCIVVSMNERMMARAGIGVSPSPDLQWQYYVNRKTGVVTRVPQGVDPGFAYNPGKAWAERKGLPKTESLKPIGALPPVLAQPGETAVKPAVLQAFIEKPEGAVQVGELSEALAKALGAESKPVLLSADTMKKQLGQLPPNPGHTDLRLKDYLALSALINDPQLAFLNKDQKLIVAREGDVLLLAVLKTTVAAHENYVQSFRRARSIEIARMLTNAKILIGNRDDWTRR